MVQYVPSRRDILSTALVISKEAILGSPLESIAISEYFPISPKVYTSLTSQDHPAHFATFRSRPAAE